MINQCSYYCIYFDHVLVGGLFYCVKSPAEYYLIRIFISPEYQNRGIGKEVFGKLDEIVTDARKWELDTPDWAVRNHHFYESLGYKKVREQPLPEAGFSLYVYEREQ